MGSRLARLSIGSPWIARVVVCMVPTSLQYAYSRPPAFSVYNPVLYLPDHSLLYEPPHCKQNNKSITVQPFGKSAVYHVDGAPRISFFA